MTTHQQYMRRCLELAKKGAGAVAPNPMVGAILVHKDKIIGEGWHQQYGEVHAEVNAIREAIHNGNEELISQATLYVSLEPCAHFGKTPPCADLIIQHKIPEVIIGCRDPFKAVNGKGIEKLNAAGVVVELGILENECKELNKRFFTFHTKQRSYIILKWAQTADGKIAPLNPSPKESGVLQTEGETFEEAGNRRLLISNEYSNRIVHRWRSEEAAILIGTNTALLDDPELTTRLWPGNSPVRLVVDRNLRLPDSLKIFNQQVRTIIFNKAKQEEDGNVFYYQVTDHESLVQQITRVLYQLNIQSVLVEGGAQLLQSFIDEGIWDEARVITNEKLIINEGLDAPRLSFGINIHEQNILADTIRIYKSEVNHLNT
ncbi:MAG TPA: bifunctional diaminohydroxyphosphoribosylaminopyrimidine deaminase/5-amino-6-(5-phosphoribosylamino)uracil reductase RibD [Chitinophagaceae bacterium]